MSEMKQSGAGEGGENAIVNGKEPSRTGEDGHEGEKERNLAKAALSIAELGRFRFFLVTSRDANNHISIAIRRFDSSARHTDKFLSWV